MNESDNRDVLHRAAHSDTPSEVAHQGYYRRNPGPAIFPGCGARAGSGYRLTTQRKTVAVVDDDSSMRVSLERLLQARGFGTEIYPSAEAFLAAACAADCLLL